VDEGHLIHSLALGLCRPAAKRSTVGKKPGPQPSMEGEMPPDTAKQTAGLSIPTSHSSTEESSRKSLYRLRKYGDESTLLIWSSSFLPQEAFSMAKIHPHHVFYGDQDNPLQG